MNNTQELIGRFVRKVFQQQKADSAYFAFDGGVSIEKVAGGTGIALNTVTSEADAMATAGLLVLTTRSTGTGLKHTQQLLDELTVIDAANAQAAADAQAAAFVPNNRALAKDVIDLTDFDGMKWRALALLLLDEFNDLRGWITDFKVEVAAASTLANLKTRVAALPDMPDRTLTQVKTAFTNKIDGGSAD